MRLKGYFPILVLLAACMAFPSGVACARSASVARLVMIDPAHGGDEPGVKLADKLPEKDLTLAVCLLLQKDLAADSHIRVLLTRSTDQTLGVAERREMARTAKPDIFLSIHVNAGFSRKATGYELYFPGFRAATAENNEAKSILRDMEANRHLNDGVRLGQEIQKQMDKVFPRKGRGLREAPMSILSGLRLPAVVLEIGFSTNPEERKILVTEETRQAIVRALGKGIRAFF